MKEALKWIRNRYNKTVNSISFYPAIISAGFLLLSWLMLNFDFSEAGKDLKSNMHWLSLKDPAAARIVVSSITGGLISLTVFSFSMVMIVMNQAASNMSNRVLDIMISNRFQQIVLGIYIGTIVYALFLLTTIRDNQSGVYIPAISIYLLVLFMVGDIFLFIYFLHYVTQTVKYETIIKKIHDKTLRVLARKQKSSTHDHFTFNNNLASYEINAAESGYFQLLDEKSLLESAIKEDIVVKILPSKGDFVLQGIPILSIHGKEITDTERKKLLLALDFFEGQSIDQNSFYGFKQLSEIAVKALSPGINDGATAALVINSISNLLSCYIKSPPAGQVADKNGQVRIITKEYNFEDLFRICMLPIWHYGKDDPYVQVALSTAVNQLKKIDNKHLHQGALNKMLIEIKEHLEKRADRD